MTSQNDLLMRMQQGEESAANFPSHIFCSARKAIVNTEQVLWPKEKNMANIIRCQWRSFLKDVTIFNLSVR